MNGYSKPKTRTMEGILQDVQPSEELTRPNSIFECMLVSPESLILTNIKIKRENDVPLIMYAFGKIPESAKGLPIKYITTTENVDFFRTGHDEIYVDGKLLSSIDYKLQLQPR